MGKADKKKRKSSSGGVPLETAVYLSPIAKPLANEKQTKKLLRLTKKASKEKQLRRGVKEVVKAIRKNEKGLCLIAGDISPIDVITHLPVLCEESDISYIYVPTKQGLGAASATKRPTSCVLITCNNDASFKDSFDTCVSTVKEASA
uniref:H/ACA ribonucleoprotein complex subunit 2 n=1 Tax=Vannella robusta TaxID=1487602 RepID=A0A7S4I9A7_9EUKA